MVERDFPCGLAEAKTELNKLKAKKPNNKNIVIVIGDGEPENDSLEDIKANATLLQKEATVFAVGFDKDVEILKDWVASDDKKYFKTDETTSLQGVINKIREDFSGESVPVQSIGGLVELVGICESKEIIIFVNGTPLQINSLDDAMTLGHIVKEKDKYYLDLKTFEAGDNIEIEYFSE